MSFIKKDIKDRVSTTDDVFTIESIGEGKSKLTPDKSGVTVEGTKVNKDLLQRYEDAIDLLLKKTGLYLEQFTWAEIKQISESGRAQDFFNIGETKSFVMNGQTYHARIIGFNHDTLSSDTSKKAGITFEFVELISDDTGKYITQKFNASSASPYFNIWNDGTQSCDLRNWLRDVIMPTLQSDLLSVIKTVKKPTSKGNKSTEVQENDETLFCLSETEMGGGSNQYASVEGEKYEYYKLLNSTSANEKRIKTDIQGTAYYYWLRSPGLTYSDNAWSCNYDGALGNYSVTRDYGVAPAFCI